MTRESFAATLRESWARSWSCAGSTIISLNLTEGEELIAGLEKADCQILFLDIEMKGMDGVAAARKLREMKRQIGDHLCHFVCGFCISGIRSEGVELHTEAL